MTWYDENGQPMKEASIDPVEAYARDLAKAYGKDFDMVKSDMMEETDGMAKMADPQSGNMMRPEMDGYRADKAEEDEESMPIKASGNGDPADDAANMMQDGSMADKEQQKGGMGYGMSKSATELLQDMVDDLSKGMKMPVGEPKELSGERPEHDGGAMGMDHKSGAPSAIDTGAHATHASGDPLSAGRDDIREDVKGPKKELEDMVDEDEDLQMKKSEEELKAELIEEIKKALVARLPVSLDEQIAKSIERHDGLRVYNEMHNGLVDSPWKNGDK